MSGLDFIFIAFIGFGLFRGFLNGFFVEVASFVALVAGVYGAIHFSNYAEGWIEKNSEWSENTVAMTAFAATFAIIVLLITLAGKALTKLADFSALGIVNKLLGALFGGLKKVMIISVLLTIFDSFARAQAPTEDPNWSDSALYEPIRLLLPSVFPAIIDKTGELESLIEEKLPLQKAGPDQ